MSFCNPVSISAVSVDRLSSTRLSLPLAAFYSVIIASGFAGLGYQSLWARLLGNAFGHDYLAVLGVVSGFFLGLSIGAYAFDKRIARAAQPGLWFAACELVIGVWALVLASVLPALPNALSAMSTSSIAPTLWAFIIPLVVLLPATVAMGATLPAADRFCGQLRQSGYALGHVYGLNTFGAVIGTLLITFWAAPQYGFVLPLYALGGMNLLCAAVLAVLSWLTKQAFSPQRVAGSQRHFLRLFLTGLLGIGFEIAAIRTLSQVLDNTVYTYAAILAVYLLATALGAGAYQRFGRLREVSVALWARLLCVSGLLSTGLLWAIFDILTLVRTPILVEIIAAALMLALPAFLMGGLFTRLASDMRGAGGGFGLGLALNTLGAALAPILVGVIVLPTLGAVATLSVLSVSYLALDRQKLFALVPLIAAGATLALPPLAPSLLKLPTGGSSVASIEGVLGTVNVYEDAGGNMHLKINNGYVMGGTASKKQDRRQGHLPLLLHPHPKKALFFGLGTGATFAAAAYHPDLTGVAVELVPEVVDVLPLFDSVAKEIEIDRQLTVTIGDARRYVLSDYARYDVIVSDTFHPSRDGAGLLYTQQHFASIKARLAPGGIFCQWLPLHQLDEATLKLIIRTFLTVFPDAKAVLNDLSLETPVIGLVGGFTRLKPDPDVMRDPVLLQAMRATDLAGIFGPLELFIADAKGLTAYAGLGPLNTDTHPRVLFEAPRAFYAGLGDPGVRLVQILKTLPVPDAITFVPARAAARLQRYWQARDAYLVLGMDRRQAETIDDQIAQLARPLVEILRISPDFTQAYDPVLAMATYKAKTDPRQAFEMLRALDALAPQRAEAGQLLDQNFPGGRLEQ